MSEKMHQAASKPNGSDSLTIKVAGALEKPCLGQPFQLGMLYDCRSDSLIPGVTLWGSEALSSAVSKKPFETSDFEVVTEDSLKEKMFHLDIDPSLEISILSGMVHVQGAAKFLNDRQSSRRQARVSLKYKSTTRFEQLTMDQLGNFEYTDVFDKDIATHVVTGMVYGADAFFVFDREVEEKEDMKKIHGNLKVKVEALPGLTKRAIGGEGSVDINTSDKEGEERLHCKFYGDLILPKHPATFHDAAKVYQELPELLQGKSVPKKVWLYPLGELDSKAKRMVRQISLRHVDELHKLMESLHDIIMRGNDLIKTEVCSNFLGLKDDLENMKGLISSYRADLEKNLATLLPKVRGGGTDETKVVEILKQNILSPFSHQTLSSWISSKENEVKILGRYLKHLKEEEVIQVAFEPGAVDVITNDLEIEAIVCFDFCITWGQDALIQKIFDYLLNGEVHQGGLTPQPWYRNQAFMQEMRQHLLCFKNFANANQRRVATKFIVTNNDSKNDTEAAFVSLYKNGCKSKFEVPDKPGKPQALNKSHTGLQLNWEITKYSASVQSYTVSYTDDEASDQWHTQTTSGAEQQLVLSGLVPSTAYWFKVRAETNAGCSPESDVCMIRMPPSAPDKPHASNITHNSLQLNWNKPSHGSETIQSYTIFYRMADSDDWNSTSYKLVNQQEYVHLPNLVPKTVYVFKVRAESTAGPSPDSEVSDPVRTLMPVSQPGKPFATKVTHDSVTLKWEKPKQGAQNLKHYKVIYYSTDNSDNIAYCIAKAERITLSKLDSKSPYIFKVEAETVAGSVSESEVSVPIKTLLSPPGKPYASDITYKGFRVNWQKPSHGLILHYSVFYQATNDPPDKWSTKTTNGGVITHCFFSPPAIAKSNSYVFKVAAMTCAGVTSDSELSDPIETKGAMVYKCLHLISNSNPPTYLLPTHCVMKKNDIVKVHIGANSHGEVKSGVHTSCSCHIRTAGIPHKVLMLVGATGAGKTTLINGIANYILGVQWDDELRFKLIAEPNSQDQTVSQTSRITAYTFYKEKDSPLPYTLTVIDTPGFGHTGGIDRDKEIVEQIKELFSISGDEGIDQLHCVGFVTQAPLARLTLTQQYVFGAILSVFGKDVADNIILMITFADGMKPPVLDAVKVAGVPYKVFFKFNNSALFVSKSADDEFAKMFWKLGTKSFSEFFKQLSNAQAQSLQLSRDVMQERETLEVTIQGLQQQIQLGLSMIDELQQDKQMLKDHEAEILTNKDFTYRVEVTKQRKIDLLIGTYTTNCLTCNCTCHDDCAYADDVDKYKCSAMRSGRGTINAECGVCPKKCSWKMHKNNPYRFELYQDYETRTSDELKTRYESAMSSKEQLECVIENMKKELDTMNMAVLRKIEQARRSVLRLQEIALKPNYLTEVEYIDQIINTERRERKPRWLDRVKALEGVRQQAVIVTELMKDPQAQQQDVFSIEETALENSMWQKILHKMVQTE